MAAASLKSLQSLHDWMRSVGAVSAKTGGIELVLGPPPAPASVPEPPEDPEVREQREDAERLQVLLHSSGASILPFLKRKA